MKFAVLISQEFYECNLYCKIKKKEKSINEYRYSKNERIR